MRLLALASLLLATASAHAQLASVTGEVVADSVARYPAWGSGYLFGVATSIPTPNVCAPPNASGNQIEAVLKKYLMDHPELHHLPFNVIAERGLRAAWPCPR